MPLFFCFVVPTFNSCNWHMPFLAFNIIIIFTLLEMPTTTLAAVTAAAKRSSSVFCEVDYSFTVMLLGDSCTGKTCLLIRFKDNTFMNNNFISTVGIDFRANFLHIEKQFRATNSHFQNKLVDLDRCKVKLQIWDTAGQERFRSLTASYYRDADALLLVYDVTKRSSFDNIRDWLAQVKEYAKESVQLILVGNKTDLASERKVRPEEGRQLAQAYNIGVSEGGTTTNAAQSSPDLSEQFMETSAKSGHNVHEVFLELSRRLVRTTAQRPAPENGRGASDALKLIDEREPYQQHQQQQQETGGWSWTGAGGLMGKGGAQCCG